MYIIVISSKVKDGYSYNNNDMNYKLLNLLKWALPSIIVELNHWSWPRAYYTFLSLCI
jgi:hypothetical protein